MPYYPTIEEDLQRAKEILERGKEWPKELVGGFHPQAVGGGATIYGADVYAAYKLLESFVAEIETLNAALAKARRGQGASQHLD